MKVWITYALEDKEFVDRLKAHLRQSDLEVLDVENEILPGDNIVESIYKAIANADLILVILSKSSNDRQWFSTEIGLIISEIRNNRHKKIIPILKDKQAVIPPFINQYQYLDLSEGKDSSVQLDKLVTTLQSRKDTKTDLKELDIKTTELIFSRQNLLEKEKYEYERQRRQKQKLISLTFLTTIFTTLIAILSVFLTGKDFPSIL